MKNPKSWQAGLTVGVFAVAAVLMGCPSKSPSEPPSTGGGGVPPSGGVGTGAWTLTVNATPSEVPLDSATVPPTSTITINVRNASTGSPPPNGTTIVVSVTGGTLSGAPTCSETSTALCPQLLNGQATLLFTGTIAGTAVVTAQLEQSVGQASILVTGTGVAPVFLLDHVQPNSGDPAGGFQARIFGQGFEEPIAVLFGGSSAQVVSVTPTRATVVVPPLTSPLSPGQTLPVSITVRNAVGSDHEQSDTLVNGFIYAHGGSVATPVIFQVTPTTGPQEGGTPIVITGNHFEQESQVIFRLSGPAGTIDLEAPTNFAGIGRLEALTPDIRSFIAAGTLNSPFNAQVRVINSNGAVAIFAGQFTYGSTIRITSLGPGQGPFSGGTIVTIFGSGFDEPVAVTLGGIGQTVLSVSGTEIRFVTTGLTGSAIPPCNGQTTATLSVTNIEGGASASGGAFTFIGPPNPVIIGISPNSGNVGSAATVSGQNFDPAALRVLFGGADGASAPIGAGATSTTIPVTVPTPPPSFQFTTVACDANGDNVASGTRALPTAISVTVRNLATGCEATLSSAFTLNPPDASCQGDTSTPPPAPTQCGDGVDNDGDGFIDVGDAGCGGSTTGVTERTQCQDFIDNDGDTLIDFPADLQCTSVQDTSELP
jgi:hypothetical protein